MAAVPAQLGLLWVQCQLLSVERTLWFLGNPYSHSQVVYNSCLAPTKLSSPLSLKKMPPIHPQIALWKKDLSKTEELQILARQPTCLHVEEASRYCWEIQAASLKPIINQLHFGCGIPREFRLRHTSRELQQCRGLVAKSGREYKLVVSCSCF